ncbi:MAG: hypothetical protein HEEMFOPI_01551 [Holosporales bacterium]
MIHSSGLSSFKYYFVDVIDHNVQALETQLKSKDNNVEINYSSNTEKFKRSYTMILKELENKQNLTIFQLMDNGDNLRVFKIKIEDSFVEEVEGTSKKEV